MNTQQGLSQYVNTLGFVAPGVMLLRDGAFLRCFECLGPDQEYRDHDLMFHDADVFARILTMLSNGWMLETHSVRVPTTVAATSHQWPDTTSALVHEEQASQYRRAGVYYETRHVWTLTYASPPEVQRQVSEYFLEPRKHNTRKRRAQLLEAVIQESQEFTKALEGYLGLWPMTNRETTQFLHLCVTGRDQVVGIAEDEGGVDYAIGSVEMVPHAGVVGDQHVRVVSVRGWPRDGTIPQMFDPILKRINGPLRMHHRFIYLSPADAVKVLRNKQKDWFQINGYNPKRILGIIASALVPLNPNDKRVVDINTDSDNQGETITEEIEAVRSGALRLGYYTMNVVVQAEEEEQAEENAGKVIQEMGRLGFSAAVETVNAADAYAGTWPGNGTKGVRKYYVNTRHLARLLPTSTQWRGEDQAPCPFYPAGSGPLLITTSAGNTPFYLNLHDGDVGNFLMIGPSGAGKTFAVNSLALGFRQYPNAQINLFDRDYGAIIPTLACGGQFYSAEAMRYAPFAHLDEPEEKEWALHFVETLATLQHFPMTPLAKADLTKALEVLSTAAPKYRTLTGYHAHVQTHVPGLKSAIRVYVGGILDGEPGPGQEASWQTWDMLKLLGQGDAVSTPVLMFLFHQIQRRLDGRPTLTIFEEGWQVAANEHLDSYTTASSANYRKQVNALGVVLHSPDNLLEFERHQLLLTNTPTVIYLPNPRANTDGDQGQRKGYERMGLGRRAIQLIAEEMTPRRDYLMVKGDKYRVFRFEHGPLAQALLSRNGRDHRARVLELRKHYGEGWVEEWLSEQGHSDVALQWHQRWQQQQQEAA